jgi:hypothetical protein
MRERDEPDVKRVDPKPDREREAQPGWKPPPPQPPKKSDEVERDR